MGIYIYGNNPNQNLTVASGDTSGDLIIFGTGAGDYVLAENGNISQNIIAFGAGAGDYVESLTGAISNDIITFHDVAAPPSSTSTPDYVESLTGAISNDRITLGNATGDFVSAQGGNVSQSVITFGNGGNDYLSTSNDLNQDAITFGNSGGDVVTVGGSADHDAIVFGNATGGNGSGPNEVELTGNLSNSSITFHDLALSTNPSSVDSSDNISNCTITFGNGDEDNVFIFGVGGASNNTFSFGNGAGDTVSVGSGDASNNTFSFGNGAGDRLLVDGPSSGNKITMGNGAGDFVSLGNLVTSPGGDYVATGTGADTVVVGAHTNPDTFAFALGTSGSAFTVVFGALSGDQVVVNSNGNGNALGNTLVPEGLLAKNATLASFIGTLGTLTKGDTYVGGTVEGGLTGQAETFIVTDTQSGKVGAIDVVGLSTDVVFTNSTISHHVLTLA